MQYFKMERKHDDHGISTISKEFFEVEMGCQVISSVTEGIVVIVQVNRRLTKTPQDYADILTAWRMYYDQNKDRFNMKTYKMEGDNLEYSCYWYLEWSWHGRR